MNVFQQLAACSLVAGLGVFAWAETDVPVEDSYPLSTCVVSGEKLGEMGDAVVVQHEGREVRFCCSGCEKPFYKNPEKYLKKLDEAEAEKAAATQPSTQPSDS